jgi:hypothetical protein
MMVVRKVAGALVAAAVAGLVIGVVARALMRLVTLAADGDAGFTWDGTASICLIYAAAMVPGALLTAFMVHPARWSLPIAGSLFLCLPAVGVASEEVGGTAGFSTLQWLGVGAGGLAVFATLAVLPIVTVRLVDRLARSQPDPWRASGPISSRSS